MSFSRDLRAVVTGAAGGLGLALAETLAEGGARVLLADIDGEAAQREADRLRAAGYVAYGTQCDVRNPDEVEALAAEADARLSGADFIANNAGVAVAGRIGDVPLEDWRWVVDVNLWGVVHGCHTFVPRFVAQGRGYVLNVASAAGLVSAPMMGPYNVTKAGVVSLSETMRAELQEKGVTVTVLCPTFFKTNIAKNGKGLGSTAGTAEKLMNRSKVQAKDVARVALKAMAKDELYALPMMDGRMLWGLKRILPGRLPRMLGWISSKTMSSGS